MGAKQSSPAENGRTRAYSGSDLPSSNGGGRTAAVAMRFPAHGASGATSSSSSSSAAVASHYTGSRTRSVGGGTGGPGARPQSSINIPTSGAYSSQDSGNSTPEERERSTGAPRLLIGSLPAHLSPHLFGGKSLSNFSVAKPWVICGYRGLTVHICSQTHVCQLPILCHDRGF
uniref:Uncharacterized protein n=1 Tax=Sinocyclocheilus rhinocerous TaxID=307959 RepID=A0A673IEW0_9TELE